MAAGEFELINTYFKSRPGLRNDVLVGIGDDAAVMTVPEGQKLVVTVDTLVENIHFSEDVSPSDLAIKALAVNLSDLAAMGAQPAWVTLSLTIPEVNHDWLAEFSQAFLDQCEFYDVQLIGGDTCRGHISVSIQAMGLVPEESMLRRSGAEVGDLVYVTGTLGDAGAGLALRMSEQQSFNDTEQSLLNRLNRPTPRLEAGMLLRQLASAAIDISDGLIQDLSHIIDASETGAVIELNNLPLSEAMISRFTEKQAQSFAMSSGDDYELCFTVNPENKDKLERVFATASTPITQIGRITSNNGLQLRNKDESVAINNTGFDHFKPSPAPEVSD